MTQYVTLHPQEEQMSLIFHFLNIFWRLKPSWSPLNVIISTNSLFLLFKAKEVQPEMF